jgi:hypothetical protein
MAIGGETILCFITITHKIAGRAPPMPDDDDPLRDAHISIGKAITELKALGVTVPVTLYLAMHALTYARAAAATNPDDEARR